MPSPAKPLASNSDIPQPKFVVGQKVRWIRGDNRDYFQKEYLKSLVKYWREHQQRVGNPHTKQGFPRPPRQRLCDGAKNIIRHCYEIVSDADIVEIIGIVSNSMYVHDSPGFNQCYVPGVPGAACGVEFRYQLLIRYKVGDNTCALATRLPVAEGRSLEPVPDTKTKQQEWNKTKLVPTLNAHYLLEFSRGIRFVVVQAVDDDGEIMLQSIEDGGYVSDKFIRWMEMP